MPEKTVFFFGAGADVPYGMPNGGEFALEIFRTLGNEDKKLLRAEISNVNEISNQSKWFPEGYQNNSITTFGRNNFESIISSTLENRRNTIINELSNFDRTASQVKSEFLTKNIVIDDILSDLGCPPGSVQYSRVIRLNSKLESNFVEKFFESDYLSALIKLIQDNKFYDSALTDASSICRSFIEMMIGALGQNLVHSLNNGVFEAAPDNLPFLNDIGGIFNLDYRRIGLDSLINLLGKPSFKKRISSLSTSTDKENVAIEFYFRIAEIIYSTFLDYQTLIDSHYRYLYQPKTEWGKFCKISTFLFAVYRYMNNLLSYSSEVNSYYEDIKNKDGILISAIGTSNYTDLVERTNCQDIYYLNGSLKEFYDPYKNDIVNKDATIFKVPFIFTQSGTKPMTGIKMCKRYADFFDACKQADRIIVLGYGFNSDDGHINTLMRSLLDDFHKHIDIILYNVSLDQYENKQKNIAYNLRCTEHRNIIIHSIDGHRKIDNTDWLNKLFHN